MVENCTVITLNLSESFCSSLIVTNTFSVAGSVVTGNTWIPVAGASCGGSVGDSGGGTATHELAIRPASTNRGRIENLEINDRMTHLFLTQVGR